MVKCLCGDIYYIKIYKNTSSTGYKSKHSCANCTWWPYKGVIMMDFAQHVAIMVKVKEFLEVLGDNKKKQKKKLRSDSKDVEHPRQ